MSARGKGACSQAIRFSRVRERALCRTCRTGIQLLSWILPLADRDGGLPGVRVERCASVRRTQALSTRSPGLSRAEAGRPFSTDLREEA